MWACRLRASLHNSCKVLGIIKSRDRESCQVNAMSSAQIGKAPQCPWSCLLFNRDERCWCSPKATKTAGMEDLIKTMLISTSFVYHHLGLSQQHLWWLLYAGNINLHEKETSDKAYCVRRYNYVNNHVLATPARQNNDLECQLWLPSIQCMPGTANESTHTLNAGARTAQIIQAIAFQV